jgi:hypothetical protein
MSPQSDGRQERYFQFPLSALAYGESWLVRLDTILDYSVVEAGITLWSKASEEERSRYVSAWKKGRYLPSGFDIRLPLHQAALFGAEIIGVTFQSVNGLLNRHRGLANFVSDFESRNGLDPLVRMRTDFLFEARNHRGMTAQEFSVLAGLYSVIGDKQVPVLIAQQTIRHRAMGYKTEKIFDNELVSRADQAMPLSDWILRSTIDRLQERNLFARVVYGRRLSYYSNRMEKQQLQRMVFERKTHHSAFEIRRRLSNEEITKAIRNARAIGKAKPVPYPDHCKGKLDSTQTTPRAEEPKQRPPCTGSPGLSQVLAWGKLDGIPPDVCEEFFLHNEGLGWMIGNSPVRCPRAWLRRYYLNRRKAGGRI